MTVALVVVAVVVVMTLALVVKERPVYGVDNQAADDETGRGATADDDVQFVDVPQVAKKRALVVDAHFDDVNGASAVVGLGDAVVETEVFLLRQSNYV